MKNQRISTVLFLLIAILYMPSCSTKKLPENDRLIDVKVVQTTAKNSTLSGREQWNFFVDSLRYTTTLTDHDIYGTPEDIPYTFHVGFGKEEEPVAEHEAPYVYFFAEGYIKNIGAIHKDPPFPAIADQQSYDELVIADMLSAKYVGIPASSIMDIPLTHANALIDIDLSALPSYDWIRIEDMGINFNPYHADTDRYLAIVTANWNPSCRVNILIRIDDKVYTANILNSGDVLADTNYKLKLKFNKQDLVLYADAIESSIWSEKEWL